jgi:hypothetical protein
MYAAQIPVCFTDTSSSGSACSSHSGVCLYCTVHDDHEVLHVPLTEKYCLHQSLVPYYGSTCPPHNLSWTHMSTARHQQQQQVGTHDAS